MLEDVDEYRLKRRDELAKELWGYSSYHRACSPRKRTIDSMIDKELQDSAAG